LVSFGTRSTLSAQDNDSIKAERHWSGARVIKTEFERYSKDCADAWSEDGFVPRIATERIPSQRRSRMSMQFCADRSEADRRIVLVTGHYDSRNSDNAKRKPTRAGSERRCSGTAVSLSARASEQDEIPTTLFSHVAGEEKGERQQAFAEMAKQHGWKLERS